MTHDTAHYTTPSRHLVQTPTFVIERLIPGQSTSPTPIPPDPPCLFLSFAQERKRPKGGSYVLVVSRRAVIACHSGSVTPPPCRRVVRAIRHTFIKYPPRAPASSCAHYQMQARPTRSALTLEGLSFRDIFSGSKGVTLGRGCRGFRPG
jgi:hypothetical protein